MQEKQFNERVWQFGTSLDSLHTPLKSLKIHQNNVTHESFNLHNVIFLLWTKQKNCIRLVYTYEIPWKFLIQ